MAHNLDINNGIASFASANVDAWHMLGTVVRKDNGELMTAEEALDAANLSRWNTRTIPAFATVGEQTLPIPGCNAVVRDNPVVAGQIDVLGNVGNSYQIIQNEEHAGLLNAIIDESGANFETAGALEGGRKVFVTMKLPGSILVGGVDQVDNYLAAINSHDGSMAFTFMVTPVRVVCANTLNMAFSDHKSIFRARHTRGAGRIIRQQAREALDLTFNFLDGFQEEAERLINTTMTQTRFEEIIAKEFGAKEGSHASAVTRAGNKMDDMVSLFTDSFTHESVRNTAWAGLNALTEWYDHLSPTKGEDRDGARAVNALLYPEFKDRARKLILAEAGL